MQAAIGSTASRCNLTVFVHHSWVQAAVILTVMLATPAAVLHAAPECNLLSSVVSMVAALVHYAFRTVFAFAFALCIGTSKSMAPACILSSTVDFNCARLLSFDVSMD